MFPDYYWFYTEDSLCTSNWYVVTFVKSKFARFTKITFCWLKASWKGLVFRSRHWPLWYTWIGYLQDNGPPWAPASVLVDHRYSSQLYECQHSYVVDGSNLEVCHSLFKIPSGLQLLLFRKWGCHICFKILSLGFVPSHTARCLPLIGYKINATLSSPMEKVCICFWVLRHRWQI